MAERPPADEQKALFEATVAAEGVTTSAGEATGLSIIDSGLIGSGANSFVSMLAIIYPGQPTLVDSKDATAFNNTTGEVTVAGAFKGGQVAAGVPYKIVTFRFVPAEVSAVKTVVDGIQTDLANTTDGLGALKALIDTLDGIADAIKAVTDNLPNAGALSDLAAILVDTGTTLPATLATIDAIVDDISANLAAAINNYLGHGTHGLSPIRSSLTTIDAIVDDISANLAAAINNYLGHGTFGLSPIRSALTNVDAIVDDILANLVAVINNYLNHATFGLSPIHSDLETVDGIVDDILEDTATTLPATLATIDGIVDDIKALVDAKVMGRSQIFEKSITSAANVGDVTVATITDQPCLIESVVIHADTAQTGNMTSCGVFGGAGKAITFISAADAVQAELDAEDKQVWWEGKVRLAAAKTIVISLVGSDGAAVDLTITIKYRACVSGGYLA